MRSDADPFTIDWTVSTRNDWSHMHKPATALRLGLLALVVISLSACAGTGGASGTSDDPGHGGTEHGEAATAVDDLLGVWGSTADRQPNLEFADDGSYSGSDGCNRLVGEYAVEQDSIVLTAGLTTLMACTGVDPWLADAASVEISGDTLLVFDRSGSAIGELARDAG